jgi:RNA polymerase sigma factor (TIGR02999 family)
MAIAAHLMREILVERARARGASKRGGGRLRVTLDEMTAVTPETDADVLALHEALERLAALDAQQARIVELRYFGGLTVEETAGELSLSPATVKRHWTAARAWLHRELTGQGR